MGSVRQREGKRVSEVEKENVEMLPCPLKPLTSLALTPSFPHFLTFINLQSLKKKGEKLLLPVTIPHPHAQQTRMSHFPHFPEGHFPLSVKPHVPPLILPHVHKLPSPLSSPLPPPIFSPHLAPETMIGVS